MRTCTPSAAGLALTLLVVSACTTQEISGRPIVLAGTQAGPDVGMVAVVFPSMDDTFEALQARLASNTRGASYQMSMDGRLMMLDAGDGQHLVPFGAQEDGVTSAGYFQAGPHDFTLAPAGGPPVFEAQGAVAGNGTTALFLFGTRDALQGRFIETSNVGDADTEHLIVVNLLHGGQPIEVVACTDAATCTTLGGPLALGDDFVADVPAVGSGARSASSLAPGGAGYGYRIVPSASLPNPPVLELHHSLGGPDFLGTPVYMSDQGEVVDPF
jgi:hypothetical protein